MGLSKQQLTMVVLLLAGAFLAVLNMTLLTPALATIMNTFSVSTTTVQWLTSAYALVEALIMPLNAYLLGRFSSRKLFVGGIALFTIGSLFCAFAPNFALLLIGRILQASATGVVMPTVFTLLLLIFPRERRGSALGLAGLVIAFAPAIGPTISGALIEMIGWRALFLVDAGIAFILVIASALTLKSFKGFDRTSLDPVSLLFLAAGMVGLLYGLSTFTSSSTTTIPVALMVVGILILALFARRQTKINNPLLRVEVFKHREFRTAAIIITFMEATLIGSGVIIPLYIQNALGDSPTVSGLLMLPGAVLGAICGLLADRLFDKFGIRKVALPGSIILLFGAAGCALLGPNATNLSVCLAYSVVVIGLQALITPVNTWGINSLPNTKIAHGNAMISTLEQVGSSMGTAFVMSLTALSALVVPSNAPSNLQSYGGCHLAFMGLLAISILIFLVILIFVRSKPASKEAVYSFEKDIPEPQGIPGIDRPLFVGDAMNPLSKALSQSSTIRDAVEIMQETETSGLPIVSDAGAVLGFLSDGDIIKSLGRHENSRFDGEEYLMLANDESIWEKMTHLFDAPALSLATKNVVSIDINQDAEEAFRMLSEKRIKKVPVLYKGRFAGCLSRQNIMRALATLEEAHGSTLKQ